MDTDGKIATSNEILRFWTSLLRDPEGKPQDRMKASEFLMKYDDAYDSRQEIQENIEVTITVMDCEQN